MLAVRSIIVILILVAAGACERAQSVAAQPVAEAAASKADARVDEWRAVFARGREIEAKSPHRPLSEELARRVALEQAGRRALSQVAAARELSPAERSSAQRAIWQDLSQIDRDNLRWLKTVLPADGWFRNSRDGPKVTAQAWLILQHADDRAFQKEVLKLLGPLAAQGEVEGSQYALLYDRLEVSEGRHNAMAARSPAGLDDANCSRLKPNRKSTTGARKSALGRLMSTRSSWV
jgi:hypothetical protein